MARVEMKLSGSIMTSVVEFLSTLKRLQRPILAAVSAIGPGEDPENMGRLLGAKDAAARLGEVAPS